MFVTLLETLEKIFLYGAMCSCPLFFAGILGFLYEHVGIVRSFVNYLVDLTRLTEWDDHDDPSENRN